jgi:hypothetical protein
MWGTRTFYFGDRIAVGVRDLQPAIARYQEKLKFRLTPFKSFDKEDEAGVALVLIPQGATKANVEQHSILFTKKIEKAHEDFASKGISMGPTQRFGRKPGCVEL